MLDRVIFSQEIISLTRKATTVPSLQTQGTLTADTLIWIENHQKYTVELKDVVGASCLCESSIAGFVVYAYPLIRDGFLKKRRRVLREYLFACPDNETRSQWVKAINNTLRGLAVDSIHPILPRHLHILLNPASGKKKRGKYWGKCDRYGKIA